MNSMFKNVANFQKNRLLQKLSPTVKFFNFPKFTFNIRHFSTNNTPDNKVNPDGSLTNEDTHNDFKPKLKVEINDDNVLKVIDEWVKNNDVVLFMKGTKEMPKCGFSNYAVQTLNFYKIKNFKAVNILESALIRESVKKYSNWPTYPQLYVKGNLVGGCDILKEMHSDGTLKELVEREGISTD